MKHTFRYHFMEVEKQVYMGNLVALPGLCLLTPNMIQTDAFRVL